MCLHNAYICSFCGKKYKHRQSLYRHVIIKHYNNKKQDQLNSTFEQYNLIIDQQNSTFNQQNSTFKQKIIINNNFKYHCKFCNKGYNINQSKWKHEQKCKIITEKKLEIENKQLKKENEELKINYQKENKEKINYQKQMEEMKIQIKDLINKNCKIHPKTLQKINNISNMTQNNTQNNIKQQNNIEQQNNKIMIGFDKMILEDVFSKKEQLKILKQKHNCLPFLIDYAHFNDNYPQLKNIKITSLSNDVAYKYDEKDKKFIALSKDQLINEIVCNRMMDIEEFKSCLYDKLKPREQEIINNLLNQFYEDEIKYANKYKDNIKFMIYNKTDK
jgi:hypothetical protein